MLETKTVTNGPIATGYRAEAGSRVISVTGLVAAVACLVA
jgi:hypothetical protein